MWLYNTISTNWNTIFTKISSKQQSILQPIFLHNFFFWFSHRICVRIFSIENFLFVKNIFFFVWILIFVVYNLDNRMSSSFVWQWKQLKLLNKKSYGISESINSTVKQKNICDFCFEFSLRSKICSPRNLVLIWELKLPIGYATKIFFSRFTSGWRFLYQYQYCVKVIEILWKLTMFSRRRTSELLTRRHSLQQWFYATKLKTEKKKRNYCFESEPIALWNNLNIFMIFFFESGGKTNIRMR